MVILFTLNRFQNLFVNNQSHVVKSTNDNTRIFV